MNLVLKHCNLSLHNKVDSEFCKFCCVGPADITSQVGYKYYLSFVDAFSRYMWIFPIKTKNETLTVFRPLKQWLIYYLTIKLNKSNLKRVVNFVLLQII